MTDRVNKLDQVFSLSEISYKTKIGVRATLFAQMISVAIQTVGLGVLSRLLEPAAFGVFAVATSVIVLIQIIQNFGAGAYLVQTPELDQKTISTILSLLVLCSIAGMAILLLATPVLSRMFFLPEFQSVLIILGLSLPASALATPPMAILQRNMQWSEVRFIAIAGQLFGVAAAITLAVLYDVGVWALVAQTIVTNVTVMSFSWYFCQWRFSIVFSLAVIRGFWIFGGMYTATRLIQFLKQWIDKMIAGANFSPIDTGYLARASSISQMSENFLLTPIAQPMFSALSRLQGQPVEWRRYAVLWIQAMVFLVCLFATVMSTAAPEIVWILLGPKWNGAVEILFLLGILFAVRSFSGIIPTLLLSLGKTRQLLYWDALTLPLIVFSALLGAQFGVELMIIFLIASNVIVLCIACKVIPWLTHILPLDIIRPFFAFGTVSICTYFISLLIFDGRQDGTDTYEILNSIGFIIIILLFFSIGSAFVIFLTPGLKELKELIVRQAAIAYHAIIA